ncbi:MAG: ribonucleoside-diphosphate reductase subunit alpha [Planctomycetota bacterium]|nr:ribonucleoside-diphosphate reductase subunit alpha [Planctomycetota bacterium]
MSSYLSRSSENEVHYKASQPFMVIKRNGDAVAFQQSRIQAAIKKAFIAVGEMTSSKGSAFPETLKKHTEQVVAALGRRLARGGILHVEDIQDQVELTLMREGEHKVARAYVLYREKRAIKRGLEAPVEDTALQLTLKDGSVVPLPVEPLKNHIGEACRGFPELSAERIWQAATTSFFDGMTQRDIHSALIMSTRALVERDPDYSYVAARLLLSVIEEEVAGALFPGECIAEFDATMTFKKYVGFGVSTGHLDARLLEFDLERMSRALKPERDDQFQYLGLQTLYDRYLLHVEEQRYEFPQAMFMRIAMGLALLETNREEKAIEFYDVLSSFDFMCSTPTLFNSGSTRPQLSSCFLTTIPDDLSGIFGAVKDNALLAKYSGGIGNDWTPVRGMGALIKGTNGQSQGVVPFMKVANDTAVAVNQGGKRKGAVCGYLETWHIDIEEFIELRKNTGDDRRRTHDMNTAHWIPDLFMKRVEDNADWTLFSPDEVPDLHDLYGKAFEEQYLNYEAQAVRGELKIAKTLPAQQLWRKMLGLLYETGHPWLTFKDPCNIRSPQRHVGVVHSSNLCTEITLNTNEEEVAVCNLGSINLAQHFKEGESILDAEKVKRTISTAMRMLDNVIDINFYTIPQARRANLRHRPVGLGVMGFQDLLFQHRTPYNSEDAWEIADRVQELVSYEAIEASSNLAVERGRYASFSGSLWDQGILPIDSLGLLAEERGCSLEVNSNQRLDWESLRRKVQGQAMRHSNCLAIAPTATIANICGVSQSIEPIYKNLFVKSNMSGEFTVVNRFLARDLKERGIWDDVMIHDLKYFDGVLGAIDRIPEDLKELYQTAFEINPEALVNAAARRQKWLDQAQSLNLYMAEPSGPRLDALYRLAWRSGLKTTYYLRSLGASHAEKSTTRTGALNAVSSGPQSCSITDPDCEACQ